MPLSVIPAVLATFCDHLAFRFHAGTALRIPLLLLGILLAHGRRTVTSWLRAADITTQFRQAYHSLGRLGHKAPACSSAALRTALPCGPIDGPLVFAVDDSPTARYGPHVEGAGIHHNPTPGPAGAKHLYGHVWVTVALLARHPAWHTLALPVRADLYIRHKDVEKMPRERSWTFRTKLQRAAAQLAWLAQHADVAGRERWVVVDGAYGKRPFLQAAQREGFLVVSRLRKDAALFSLPPSQRRPGQRGPMPTYGKERISLARRAAHRHGWQQVECVQYGKRVSKTIKTFVATWRPAGGAIRVVLVKEEDGTWLAFFCTKVTATAQEILERAADRGALEQTFKDVKEVWGAGEQQVRNVDSNVGCCNANLWMATLTEAWAWHKEDEALSDRRACPWDKQERRPSHADKRKALQREILRERMAGVLQGRPSKAEIRDLVEELLQRAA
jgi:hypothetical protein